MEHTTLLSTRLEVSLERLPAAQEQALAFVARPNPIANAAHHLLSLQHPEGYWEAPFEMDVRQTAEYIFLKHIFEDVDIEEEQALVRHILQEERPGGGWSTYHGGPPDLATTVTAYYALLLGGFTKDDPVLQRAKDVILSQGGVMKANCFTRGYLMLFGQMDPSSLPAMPVEIMLFPKWFPFNIYSVSSWSRAIMIPLFIIKAVWNDSYITPGPSCDELCPEDCDPHSLPQRMDAPWLTWRNFFLVANHIARMYEQHPVHWLRQQALAKAHQWVAQHMGREGGVSAIFPSMVNACLALYYLGYDKKHPLIQNEYNAIKELKVIQDDQAWIQPCFSTVWDTAWCLKILPELGVPKEHPSLVKAKEFLLEKQIGETGDWQERIPPVPCGGWYFQRENALYPDTDDTAAVLMALHPYRDEAKVQKAAERAIRWLWAMQCKDGGWAAFDYQGKVYECFNEIPFAEHGALLDPPTADVTGRIIESLALWGCNIQNPNIQRAIKWILKDQQADGSWYGRWGVNYIYGTWAVLCGLQAIGFDMSRGPVRKAVRWFLDHQRPDGGWGETCASYKSPSLKAQGDSTASQTAWALMALDAAGESNHPAVKKGIQYLITTQKNDGSWDEEAFTGTGFPGVCYLRYHLYRDHFPALALARLLKPFSQGFARG